MTGGDIPDVAMWASVDALYAEILGSHKPARTIIPCGLLHYGALLELNAVEVIHDSGVIADAQLSHLPACD